MEFQPNGLLSSESEQPIVSSQGSSLQTDLLFFNESKMQQDII